MMSVLIIYDGWQQLKLIDVVGIIVGPVIAIVLGHIFSAVIAAEVEAGRALVGSERMKIVRSEVPFLLVCVPPLVVVIVLFLVGLSLAATIEVVLWFGVASLGAWAGVAAHRAGVTGWRLWRAVAIGLLIGLVVLSLQVMLQPGKAVHGGVAIR